ncbi:threonylcarbamoyl-AMP synthase, partial [bacterium]|nr:threonylcarbamoyl-AMP synthase [bacterium]
MEILRLNPKRIEREKLKMVTNLLKNGKIIIFPTDTIYGFLADATNKKAVNKIFRIKKRSFKKPLPLFVRDIKYLKKLAILNKEQERLLKLMGNRVTVVLNRRKTKMKLYGVRKETIAIRIPEYPPLNFLLKEIGNPLVQSSVNISGRPPLNNIKEIIREFKN